MLCAELHCKCRTRGETERSDEYGKDKQTGKATSFIHSFINSFLLKPHLRHSGSKNNTLINDLLVLFRIQSPVYKQRKRAVVTCPACNSDRARSNPAWTHVQHRHIRTIHVHPGWCTHSALPWREPLFPCICSQRWFYWQIWQPTIALPRGRRGGAIHPVLWRTSESVCKRQWQIHSLLKYRPAYNNKQQG